MQYQVLSTVMMEAADFFERYVKMEQTTATAAT
jgi:hypothetical protein